MDSPSASPRRSRAGAGMVLLTLAGVLLALGATAKLPAQEHPAAQNAPQAVEPAAPTAARAQTHPCAAQAAEQALKLLKFHSEGDERAQVFKERARHIGTVKALRGKGRFDVIEVPGGVYKGDYRMRLIYARIGDQCVLMGQEVLEEGDPFRRLG